MIKKLRRGLFRLVPFPQLESDVTDIVYLNWLIDIEKVAHLCPDRATLVDINGKTILSVLTYRHGHFRPLFLRPLKKFFPSPYQSNWRLYLQQFDGKSTQNSVLFLKNMMNSLLFALGTRLMSDAMLTHWPKVFRHARDGHLYETVIAGNSHIPDLFSRCSVVSDWSLPPELIEHFGSQEKLLQYLCLQDFSYTEVSDIEGICKAQIDLPINTEEIIPLMVESLESQWLDNVLGADAVDSVFAFAVPSVHFRVLSESVI